MLKQSGIGAAISKQYPFGPRYPLYDEHESHMWKDALNRRKALIAFDRLNEKSSLLDAIGIDSDEAFDCVCPQCSGWAYEDYRNEGAAWCPLHGIVKL